MRWMKASTASLIAHWRRSVTPPPPLARKVGAELIGTAFLVMAVVGSGIAAVRLSEPLERRCV